MAEYIDKKYLDRKFQIDMMCLRGGTIFDNRKIIDSLPTADVIERSKINKAIEEMEIHIKCNTDQKTGKVNILGQGQIMMLDILKRNIGE